MSDEHEPKAPGRHSPGCPCPHCERERDDKRDNVIPISSRQPQRGQPRPYLEPPERHDNVASVSMLVDQAGQPSGRVGLWFYIRGYPGIALTPTQSRMLGRLLTLAADDVETNEPEPPKAS